jgi:hypothetical protein
MVMNFGEKLAEEVMENKKVRESYLGMEALPC